MKQSKLKVISAKDLGRLNMPDFCPRCFWIERHVDKPPGIFPGIFSTLDAITKRSTHRSFVERGEKPNWLEIEDLVEVEEGDTYFKLPVEQGDWILTGYPDDILESKMVVIILLIIKQLNLQIARTNFILYMRSS